MFICSQCLYLFYYVFFFFSFFRNGNIKTVVINDETIMQCGKRMINRSQSKKFICSSLRGLARYVLIYREIMVDSPVDLKVLSRMIMYGALGKFLKIESRVPKFAT